MDIVIHCAHSTVLAIADLKKRFHPRNPNIHSDAQIERLAKILKAQGARKCATLSKTSGYMTAGHGRVLAAERAGFTHFPVDYQDYASEELEYADLTADNAIASWAELDLPGINAHVPDLGPDFDLDLLGIENFVLEPAEKLEPGCDEDDVPGLAADTISKPGDIWQLGRHRLMCGDSTLASDLDTLMGADRADLVFTDPPYGVSYEGGHNTKKRAQIQNDSLAGNDLTDLFHDALAMACAFSHDHSAFYIWYANGKAVETFKSFARLPLKVRAVLCWYKVKSGLGAFMSQYIPNYEPCIYAFKDGCTPQWFGPTDEKTVWELRKERVNEYHPTQKPVELPERAIGNSSKAGDIVLDLFGGSGSTLIACEKTNRRCFMMELDPKYVDVIVARWEKYTGLKAERLNGETEEAG